MPRPGPYSEELVEQIKLLKGCGHSWKQTAKALGLGEHQVINIAARAGIRSKLPKHPQTPRKPPAGPQTIPRGVPTLPPLPSLQVPLPKISGT